ncbi:MAG: hypothetical protein JWO31_3455 [Phycisphaerales bacterium]|nr:hypothetical protein [Phycisphaerales bacterium]
MAVTPPNPDPAAGAGYTGRTRADDAGPGTYPPGQSPPGYRPPGADGHTHDGSSAQRFASWQEVSASLVERVGEIREYVGYYAATKTDAIKQQAIWVGVYAVLGVVAAVVGLAALVTTGVLLMTGIAGALGALFGGRPWLGQLVTAVLVLALIGVGAVVGMKVLAGTFRKSLRAKYDQRHEDQRARFGADVPQRARERQAQEAAA